MSQKKKILLSIELSNKKWKLCFSDGSKFRQRTIEARDQWVFMMEVEKAKDKFGMNKKCEVVSCYEAGREGFWIHRFLEKKGIKNKVMDPSSIEVNRRSKQRKTDWLDAEKLTRLLIRYEMFGEKKAFSVVRVPSREEEAGMRTFRERENLKREGTRHNNRIKALVNLHGIESVNPVKCNFEKLVDWEGEKLPEKLIRELQREQERLIQVNEQLKEIEKYQGEHLKAPTSKAEAQGQRLAELLGVGKQSAWALSHEYFGWREFKNRKQVGACAGLTGTPYNSGESQKDQGISKAGNKRIRYVMVELAWSWLRFQPESSLSKWYIKRFAEGGKRQRRVGIVALARKLLIALWKYVEYGEIIEGAVYGGTIR